MADKQEFKIRVRQFANGEVFAASHHQLNEGYVDLDDESGHIEGAFREFDLTLSATPPDATDEPGAVVDVADGAQSVAVDVPEAIPA